MDIQLYLKFDLRLIYNPSVDV